jgi:hypothetical protein
VNLWSAWPLPVAPAVPVDGSGQGWAGSGWVEGRQVKSTLGLRGLMWVSSPGCSPGPQCLGLSSLGHMTLAPGDGPGSRLCFLPKGGAGLSGGSHSHGGRGSLQAGRPGRQSPQLVALPPILAPDTRELEGTRGPG